MATPRKQKPAPLPPPPTPFEVGQALMDAPASIDSEVLLREMVRAFGGATRLATHLVDEFKAGAAGGMTRQRILEMMQRLVINNTDKEIGKSLSPSDMTTADLEREATRLLKRLNDNAPPAAGTP